ncbi:MAG: D-alanyl-D-alanine carboxypeptidase family protein [Candidatus Saccharibacteria bacterium]|nr:D-alanyl-D-alanine carboxypeptidase family protein [Candidatus Saccharibacteria bacterium]MCY4088816.1 D-alanyl-D-alanine carboxypeptidase family protein [Candidatus Saccharibacteria bacterium]
MKINLIHSLAVSLILITITIPLVRAESSYNKAIQYVFPYYVPDSEGGEDGIYQPSPSKPIIVSRAEPFGDCVADSIEDLRVNGFSYIPNPQAHNNSNQRNFYGEFIRTSNLSVNGKTVEVRRSHRCVEENIQQFLTDLNQIVQPRYSIHADGWRSQERQVELRAMENRRCSFRYQGVQYYLSQLNETDNNPLGFGSYSLEQVRIGDKFQPRHAYYDQADREHGIIDITCPTPLTTPGYSKHQLGLGFDLFCLDENRTWWSVNQGGRCSEDGNLALDWIKCNAHQYGLINPFTSSSGWLTEKHHWEFPVSQRTQRILQQVRQETEDGLACDHSSRRYNRLDRENVPVP